jgi:hypothetical protein
VDLFCSGSQSVYGGATAQLEGLCLGAPTFQSLIRTPLLTYPPTRGRLLLPRIFMRSEKLRWHIPSASVEFSAAREVDLK